MSNVGTRRRFDPNVAKRFGNRGAFVANMVNARLILRPAARALRHEPAAAPTWDLRHTGRDDPSAAAAQPGSRATAVRAAFDFRPSINRPSIYGRAFASSI